MSTVLKSPRQLNTYERYNYNEYMIRNYIIGLGLNPYKDNESVFSDTYLISICKLRLKAGSIGVKLLDYKNVWYWAHHTTQLTPRYRRKEKKQSTIASDIDNYSIKGLTYFASRR